MCVICFFHRICDLRRYVFTLTFRGNACLCSELECVFVTNLNDGVDQYKLPSLERLQTYTHAITGNYSLQIACSHKGNFVVCGGDSGFGRVFDQRTGEVKRLDHHSVSSRLLHLCTILSLYRRQQRALFKL